MLSDKPHFVMVSPRRFFMSLKFYYLFLFDKLLTYYCSSSFLTCIVLGLIKIIHSQEHPSTAVLKTLKNIEIVGFGLLS